MSKKLDKKIFRKVRNANLKYNLVEDGDHIAVGVSGGKDSLCLLHYLSLLKKYTPLEFEISPIYLDLGWNNDISEVEQYCHELGFNLHKEKTDIAYIVFEARQENNPCSLCANLRRGALNRTAKSFGCNKVALGHHADDAVDTLFLSMLYEGRYHLFKPKTYLDRIDITVIRPLIYVNEDDIKGFIRDSGIKPAINLCPADGFTKRDLIKDIISSIEEKCPGARAKILSSIENTDKDSFWSID